MTEKQTEDENKTKQKKKTILKNLKWSATNLINFQRESFFHNDWQSTEEATDTMHKYGNTEYGEQFVIGSNFFRIEFQKSLQQKIYIGLDGSNGLLNEWEQERG